MTTPKKTPDREPAEEKRRPTFEEALERLEKIVAEMDSGRMPLDDALRRFEEASKLAEFCSAQLDKAEKKIEILTRKADGSEERVPFDPGIDGTRESAAGEGEESGGETGEDREERLF